jgi:hypothetical protein
VDDDVMVEPTQEAAVLDAGFPAAGLVLDAVDLARRSGLPAAARLGQALTVIDRHVEDYIARARLKPAA